MLDDVRQFQLAATVIAIAIADDAFLDPEAGTSAGDHLASGLIPITIALLGALAYPRLRPGLRAGLALIFGALALEAGIVDGIRHALISTIAGDDVTAILAALAGAGLLVLGVTTLWRTRRLDEHLPRRYARRTIELALAAIVVVLAIVPTGMAILATHVARAPVPAANLGAAYRSVSFTTSDGLRLAGWYVPSRNGAAVIVSPGRSPAVQEHARLLIHHGYGVLVFDWRAGRGSRPIRGACGRLLRSSATRALSRAPMPGRVLLADRTSHDFDLGHITGLPVPDKGSRARGSALETCATAKAGLDRPFASVALLAKGARGGVVDGVARRQATSVALLCRGCESRRSACWRPDPRRLASARRCRSPG